MTAMRWPARLCKAAVVALAALSGVQAGASLLPPDAVFIQFESTADRLTQDGLVSVDRLAVRAAQCRAKDLAVHLQPAEGADATLARQRVGVVQQRLRRLGLKMRVQMKALRSSEARNRPRHRDVLIADVGAGEDVWCSPGEGSQIFVWAHELGRHVEGHTRTVPAFWQQLSAPVKQLELAQPLAEASYCGDVPRCRKHPRLYPWLAEQVLESASTERRRQWLIELSLLADAAEVERFRVRWDLSPVTASERTRRIRPPFMV